jgi:hypothetical protein
LTVSSSARAGRWVPIGAAILVGCSLACGRIGSGTTGSDRVAADGSAAALFAEDFESGTLDGWSDGLDPTRHRIVTDPAAAQSGRRYLAVTYPAGADGGWLTRFLPPGHDSLYLSYYIRFPRRWSGGTKLAAFHGSREDDPWSAFGKAGVCPGGGDFFNAMLVLAPAGELRFYSYYPGMAREPDGATCWGRFGDGGETYHPPLTLDPDVWHRLEFLVTLNAPGRTDARQTFWVDGGERGAWSGFSFRDSSRLRLNALQLTFSVSGGAPQTQDVHVDNLIVLSSRPAIAAQR